MERTAGQGRRIEHTLTDARRDALGHGHRIAPEVLRGLFDPLSESERQVLAATLAKLTVPAAPVSTP